MECKGYDKGLNPDPGVQIFETLYSNFRLICACIRKTDVMKSLPEHSCLIFISKTKYLQTQHLGLSVLQLLILNCSKSTIM